MPKMAWHIISGPVLFIVSCVPTRMVGYSDKNCATLNKELLQFLQCCIEIFDVFENMPQGNDLKSLVIICDLFQGGLNVRADCRIGLLSREQRRLHPCG